MSVSISRPYNLPVDFDVLSFREPFASLSLIFQFCLRHHAVLLIFLISWIIIVATGVAFHDLDFKIFSDPTSFNSNPDVNGPNRFDGPPGSDLNLFFLRGR
jgi:hypothetical protein